MIYLYLAKPNLSVKKTKGRIVFYDLSGDKFNDNGFEKKIDGRIVLSRCNIGSKYGKEFKSKIAVHWDCSNCTIPHNEQYIKTVFSRDWFKIMKKTLIVK